MNQRNAHSNEMGLCVRMQPILTKDWFVIIMKIESVLYSILLSLNIGNKNNGLNVRSLGCMMAMGGRSVRNSLGINCTNLW